LCWLFLRWSCSLCPGWPGPAAPSYLCFLAPPRPVIGWDGVLWTFCLSQTWTEVLWIRYESLLPAPHEALMPAEQPTVWARLNFFSHFSSLDT
jgi:hypothetical protein